jgi:hypothetical protein
MPSCKDKKRSDSSKISKSPIRLGIINYTAQYEGWFGQLYTPTRYEYRGKVAKTRFERECLSEYAEVFKTVCVDAAYYTFPI